jgi:hypothetical protein
MNKRKMKTYGTQLPDNHYTHRGGQTQLNVQDLCTAPSAADNNITHPAAAAILLCT